MALAAWEMLAQFSGASGKCGEILGVWGVLGDLH